MTIITTVLSFVFDNPLGKFVVGGLGLAALFSAWLISHDAGVRAGVHAQAIEAGAKNARKAEAVRRSVDKLPDGRLRDTYFRD